MSGIGPLPEAAAQAQLPYEELNRLYGHEGPVLCVRFNTGGNYCLSGGKVGLLVDCPLLSACPSNRIALCACGTRFAAPTSRPMLVRAACAHSGACRHVPHPGHGYEIRDVATTHDNSQYVAGMHDQTQHTQTTLYMLYNQVCLWRGRPSNFPLGCGNWQHHPQVSRPRLGCQLGTMHSCTCTSRLLVMTRAAMSPRHPSTSWRMRLLKMQCS